MMPSSRNTPHDNTIYILSSLQSTCSQKKEEYVLGWKVMDAEGCSTCVCGVGGFWSECLLKGTQTHTLSDFPRSDVT